MCVCLPVNMSVCLCEYVHVRLGHLQERCTLPAELPSPARYVSGCVVCWKWSCTCPSIPVQVRLQLGGVWLFPFPFHGFLGLCSDWQACTSALVYHLTDLNDWVFVGVNFSAKGTVVYFDFLTKEWIFLTTKFTNYFRVNRMLKKVEFCFNINKIFADKRPETY